MFAQPKYLLMKFEICIWQIIVWTFVCLPRPFHLRSLVWWYVWHHELASRSRYYFPHTSIWYAVSWAMQRQRAAHTSEWFIDVRCVSLACHPHRRETNRRTVKETITNPLSLANCPSTPCPQGPSTIGMSDNASICLPPVHLHANFLCGFVINAVSAGICM